MSGQDIIVRTLSEPAVTDKNGNRWQYNSRSDRHSKVACWAILFDLLQASNLLQNHVRAGKVTFGINRQLNDWESGKKKNLDLVVARAPGPGVLAAGAAFDLAALAEQYAVVLTEAEREILAGLPLGPAGEAGSTVLVALEAKACMTAHVRALPRLYDELTSSHSIVHGDNPNALSIGFVMVNAAERFVSSDLHRRRITDDAPVSYSTHSQPHAAQRTVATLREIRRRPGPGSGRAGFDAMGIMLVDMVNDGTPVTLVTTAPAPRRDSSDHYDQMISRAAHLYDSAFAHVT